MKNKTIEKDSHKKFQPSIHQSVSINQKNQSEIRTSSKFKSHKKNQKQGKKEFIQIKKQFAQIVDKLQLKYHKNNHIYKQKYLELSDTIFKLYKQVTDCQQISLFQKCNEDKVQKPENNNQKQNQAFQTGNTQLVVEYCIKFCHRIKSQFLKFENQQKILRKQMLDMFTLNSNHNFLQTLAKKNLQVHQLTCKNQELSCQLSIMKQRISLSSQNVLSYQQRFKQLQDDYNLIIVSMANMLKTCQTNQIELKQQNRLQGQLLQSHKIQFERYKMNFKQRQGLSEKQNKMRRILQKQYEEKQKMLQKKMMYQQKLLKDHNKI